LSKGMSDGGCSDPSVVEWGKDKKLIMMTACDDGRRRVYESGDKGESWTEALGTLSRVWSNKKGEGEKGVRSGFITATIDGVDKRNVMLVTLPVYSKEDSKKEKGELHLWLTDNTHIVDIGPVSGNDDVAASSLLYKIGNNNEEKLIALYEKKKAGDDEKPSLGMVSVLLTAQLQRVKDVLATWKKVDERVSKLCLSLNVEKDTSSGTAMPTNGLVGFLSGNFSNDTWREEYLGVNATVKKKEGATAYADGVKFQGAWAEWPVGAQGDNQLYHFANYNFTLVATVSIDGVPTKEGNIPLMGVKMNGDDKTVLLGLSYNKQKNWEVLSSGTVNRGQSSTWEPGKTHQVVIVLHNGTQGSAYVDGQRVGNASCGLQNTKDKGVSHFFIGGDVSSAGSQEGVSVTVTNVLLYNRPWNEEEVGALNPNKEPITSPVTENVPETMLQSPAKPQPSEQETLTTNIDGVGGGVSRAASIATTVSSDVSQEAATGSGDTMLGNGSPQTPEVGASSGEDGETAEGTDGQKEDIHAQFGEVNAAALSSSLGNLSQGNNSDSGTVRGSGLLPLLLLLLLGLWGLAAL
ncbi:trans-sialidase, partial [Trypanosoma cruzi]